MAALQSCVIAILACLVVCPASYAQLDVFDKFDSWLSDHEALVAKHGYETLLQVEASKDSHQGSDDHKSIMDHISNGARLAQERRNAILSLVQTDVGLAYSKLLSQDMNQPQVGDDFSVSDGRESAGLPASVNALVEMRLDSFANITASSKLLAGRQTSEAESPSIGGHTLARRPGHGGDDSQVSDGGAASEVHPEIGNGESGDGSTDDESTDNSTESDDGIGSLSDEERLVSGADGAAITSRPINFGPFKYDTLTKGSKKEMTATEGSNLEFNDLEQLVYDLKLEDGRSCNLLFTSNPPSSSLNQASVHGFIIPQGSGFLCVVDPQPFRDVDVMGPRGGDVVMFGDTPVEFESRKEMVAATANLFSLRSMSLSPDVSFPLPEESVLGRASAKSMAIITKPLQSEKSVSPDGVPLLHRLERAAHQFRGLEQKVNRDNDESSSRAQTQSLVSGKKKVLVGICEFNDVKFQQADKQFFSPNKMEELMAEMGDWIKEASYDNLELEFTVVPQVLPDVGRWRKVETTKSSAITSRGRDQAISMGKAAAKKIDPKYDASNFDFHLWVFPPEASTKTALFHPAWGILGMAVIRGPGLILSAPQADFQYTVIHEFGHNLGLHHSKAWKSEKGVNKLDQYGDKSDVMGGYDGPMDAVPYFQVGQQHWLHWVDDSDIATVEENDVSAEYEIVSKTGNGQKNAVRGVRVKTADETGWYYIEYSVIGQSQIVRIHRRNVLNTMMVLGANLDGALIGMFSPTLLFVDGRGAISIACSNYAADKVKVEVKRKLPDAEFHFGDLEGLKGLKRVRKSGLLWRNSAQLDYKCRVEVVYGGVTEKTAKKDAVYNDQKKTWKVAFGETVSMALSDSKPLIRVQCKENTGVAWFSIGDKELRSIDVTKHDKNHGNGNKDWETAPLKNGKREATLNYWTSTSGIDRL